MTYQKFDYYTLNWSNAGCLPGFHAFAYVDGRELEAYQCVSGDQLEGLSELEKTKIERDVIQELLAKVLERVHE